MNTLLNIKHVVGLLVKIILLVLLATIALNLLDRAGISPFVAAFLIIFCKGLLRCLFGIICFFVSAGILIWILSLIL